jgi:hypothetical protein
MGIVVVYNKRTSAAAPPAFAPTDIAGLRLWLDAQDATTYTLDTSGGRDSVSQWRDKSGGARHFEQSTKANQPTFQTTSALKSLPGLVFSTISQYSLVGVAAALNLYKNMPGQTTFVVIRVSLIPAVEGRILSVSQSGSTSNTLQVMSTRAAVTFRAGDKIRSADSFVGLEGGTPVINTNYIFCSSVDAINGDIYSFLNGSALVSNTSWQTPGNFENLDHGDARIGGRAADRWFDGVIGEMISYGSYLSPTDRASVFTYLNTKWSAIY